MTGLVVRPARADDAGGLAEVLAECVAAGASVGFMAPLEPARARAWWDGALADADRGGRLVLVAEADGAVVGTVQVVTDLPENQPHRGELAKLLVRPSARRRGAGAALLAAAEEAARGAGRTLLVLDTASAEAERLYGRAGWCRVGVIPDYALGPEGGLVPTVLFYKDLGPPALSRAGPSG